MNVVRLDLATGVPPYAQIAGQIRRAVLDGTLSPGDRLATVRQMARDLGVAENTVARAYRELEEAGLVVTAGRRGTSVAPTLDREALARHELDRAARRFAQEVGALRLSRRDAIAAVNAALGA